MLPITIRTVTDYLETISPVSYQESYDNAGLVVGYPTTEVRGILTTLDITEQVLEEAVVQGCNLVISHHPLIFRPLYKVDQGSVGRAITYAIQNKLALYSLHTNLDYVMGGVNTALGKRLGLSNLSFLKRLPIPSDSSVVSSLDRGAGMIGSLPQPLSEEDFLAYLKEKLSLTTFRYSSTRKQSIQQVAIAGGVGIGLLPDALAASADAFVTADIKYHQFLDSDYQLLLVDIGHYESEVHVKTLLAHYLSEKFNKIVLKESTIISNPIKYYV
ncbi:MAG: Nif3-like dinuclear metal center hexameric protein [Bacteroidota bacterium]